MSIAVYVTLRYCIDSPMTVLNDLFLNVPQTQWDGLLQIKIKRVFTSICCKTDIGG